ncbi:MAG: type II 3-dehydroquinate dehydratase [Elusimicrobiota bacterium]
MAKKRVLLISGPNLSLLGKREPDTYGSFSLPELENGLIKQAEGLNIRLECFQSDIEGEIVKKIGEAWAGSKKLFDGIIINPGGYTHTSVAIHDAIKASTLPAIEAHISQIYKREEFRHTSVISSACIGQIAGFGGDSYYLALIEMSRHLSGIRFIPK